MRTVYSCDSNKVLSLKFPEGYQVWQKAPKEGQRVQQAKCFYYSNHQNDDDDGASLQKYEQILTKLEFTKT